MVRAHVPASAVKDVDSVKSGRSATVANYVEAGAFQDGVAIRNSNDPGSGALQFAPSEWRAFVLGAKDGDFDHLI